MGRDHDDVLDDLDGGLAFQKAPKLIAGSDFQCSALKNAVLKRRMI